ncbi:hypothetical protein Tco_1033053 [Tanacetum coccineum]|uniref:Uncharacterized protein n=1 Tax=Tanacetum coccineum TaxID=301880 RepID=A0ABQ5GFN2_9ASTR
MEVGGTCQESSGEVQEIRGTNAYKETYPKKNPEEEGGVGRRGIKFYNSKAEIFTLRAQQLDPSILVPTYKEIERDQLTETTHISIVVAKSDGTKKGDDTDSYDTFLLNQEDLGTSLGPESHKEILKGMISVNVDVDDNDDDQQNVDALIMKKKMGSSEIRDAKMQTSIFTSLDPLGLTCLWIRKQSLN